MINLQESSYLYIPLDIQMPENVRIESISFFDSLPESLWNPNKFRNSYFLTLYTRSISEVKKDNEAEELKWLMNKTPMCLRSWIEDKLMPYFEPFGRVALIKSLPGDCMNVHVDAGKVSFDRMLMEPKFRYVMDGTLDDLYFETNEGSIQCKPCSPSYIIDGAWPHYAINKENKRRYVLGVGRPWLGQINDRLKKVIETTLLTKKEQVLDRYKYQRVSNIYENYTEI